MESFIFKKSYGQNFLNDNNIIKNIVLESNILPNSLVIEIGPGSGNLTREIARYATNVLCYEIDTRLEEILDSNLGEYKNISIIYDDFLSRNILNDISNFAYDNIYVIANLPYYITTPILMKLIESNINFRGITIMIQKEVGERFTANVGTKDYSSITVFLNYYFDIKKLFTVSRECFTPKPNVDSIVIQLLSKNSKLELKNKDLFFQIVRDSFRFKRKNIRNNLKNYNLEIIENVLKKYHFDLNVRAEQLSIEVFQDISNSL